MTDFDKYADPAPSTETGNPRIDEGFAALQDPQVGYGEDITKGAAGGLGRGVAGMLGIGGTVGGLVRSGLGYAGVPEDYLTKGAAIMRTVGNVIPQARILTGPDASQVQKSMEDYTGKFYQPQTVPGQYASTLAEFAPSALVSGGGGIGARLLNTVVPAVASETAGQATKGTAAEPYARFVAGLAAGPLATKAITPMAAPPPALQRNIDVLTREGIPLTAGQRTGNRALQWAESNAADMPLGGGAKKLQSDQAEAFDRAITAKIYDPAELRARGVPEGVSLPDPRVAAAGQQSLSDKYTQLTTNNQLKADPTLISDIYAAEAKYNKNVLPSQQTKDIQSIRDDIANTLIAGQGSMPGDVYQATRSRLGRNAKGMTDPERAAALRDMRGALDRAMERSLPPDAAAEWQLNNRRYANMKQVGDPATAAAGENLSPLKVAQTARSGRAGQYAAQKGDFDELAKAAATVMKPLPNSGTASRLGMQQLFNMIPNALAGSAGGAAAGSVFGPVGAVAGAAAPFVVPKLITSKLGQAYLGNQLMPQDTRSILAQALLQQSSTKDSNAARNNNAMDVYEQMRRYRLRQAGLE